MMPTPNFQSNYWVAYGPPPGYPTQVPTSQSYPSRDRSPDQASYAGSSASRGSRGTGRRRTSSLTRAPVLKHTQRRKVATKPFLIRTTSSAHDDGESDSEWSVNGDVGEDEMAVNKEAEANNLGRGLQVIIQQLPREAAEPRTQAQRRPRSRASAYSSRSDRSDKDNIASEQKDLPRGRKKVAFAPEPTVHRERSKSHSRVRGGSRAQSDIADSVPRTFHRTNPTSPDVAEDSSFLHPRELEETRAKLVDGVPQSVEAMFSLSLENGIDKEQAIRSRRHGHGEIAPLPRPNTLSAPMIQPVSILNTQSFREREPPYEILERSAKSNTLATSRQDCQNNVSQPGMTRSKNMKEIKHQEGNIIALEDAMETICLSSTD